MASRTKDVRSLTKHLLKRYSSAQPLASNDRKLLDILVYALFLENGDFERALTSFDSLERYFIDWNEIRVAKADEIAEVVGNYKGAARDGERLRRLLQSIFDQTFRFDLEDLRTRGVDALTQFLDAIPYSTRFMNDFVKFFAFNEPTLPCSEGMLRVLRAVGLVEVRDEAETPILPSKRFTREELTELFILLFQCGADLATPEKQDEVIKFLASFDKSASKRSLEPLVEPKWPSDPREIARLLIHKERARKSPAALKDDVRAEAYADDDDEHDPDEEPGITDPEAGEETILTMDSASVSSTTVPEETATKSKRRSTLKKSAALNSDDLAPNSNPAALDLNGERVQEARGGVASASTDESSDSETKRTRAPRTKKADAQSVALDAKSESQQAVETESAAEDGKIVKGAKKAASKSGGKGKVAKKDDDSNAQDESLRGVTSDATAVVSDAPSDGEKSVQAKKKSTRKVKSQTDDDLKAESSVAKSQGSTSQEIKTPKKSSRATKKSSDEDEATSSAKKKSAKRKDELTKDSQAEPPDGGASVQPKKKRARKSTTASDSSDASEKNDVAKQSAAAKKSKSSSKSQQDEETKIQEIQQKKPR